MLRSVRGAGTVAKGRPRGSWEVGFNRAISENEIELARSAAKQAVTEQTGKSNLTAIPITNMKVVVVFETSPIPVRAL